MARTVARGNQPHGQPAGENPFGPAFEALGQFVVQSIGERIQGHKRRGRAEEMARTFGGETPPRQVQTPQQGTQGQQPFSIPATQNGQTVNRASGQQPTQNPLVAAGITPRGAPTSGPVGNRVIQQTLQNRGAMPERQRQPTNRPAPSAGGAPEGAPGGQGASQIAARQFEGTPRLGQGATRQEQLTTAGQRPQIEAAAQEMSRQPGSMGELMRRMPFEQRVEVIDRMMEQGVRLDQIMALGVRERPDPNTDLAKLRSDFQSGLLNRDEFMAQRQRILQGQGDRMSTDQLEAQTIQQMNTGELSREEGRQRLQLIRGPQGGDLSAKARTVSALERRKRGEQTGTSIDAFTPERAGEVQQAMINQPQRFEIQTDQFGRQFMLDTQSGTQTLITDRPGLINEPAPGTGQSGGTPAQGGQTAAGAQDPSAQPPSGQERPSTASRLVSGEGELGIVGRIQSFGNVLMPQFGSQLPQPERTEISNDLQGMRERLVSALRDNRRLLSTQVATIQNLLPDPQAFFDNTPQALAQMTAARGRLLADRNRLEKIANDPKAAADQAEQAAAAVNQIDPLIGELSVNADTFTQADAGQSFEFAQALTPTAARGLDAGTVDSMVGKLTDDQLFNLDRDVRSVLIDKLRGNADGNGT